MLLFSNVAFFFKEIEKRSGRLEMTDQLANLFKQTDVNEIDKLVYIIQGILAPPYEGIDLGMGERFALAAIAASSGYPSNEVEKNYKKSGDLGDTAEELLGKKKQTALSTTEMEISYLFDALMKIAKSSGPGSQDQKIKILTELLNNSSGLESRYVIRYVTGSLRLGVGDPTILDALSVAHVGDKSLREPLERAYNTCSDLGYVAKVFYTNPKKIESFVVTPFKPLMPALAERENAPEAIIERLGKCGIEMKYDGFRLQCHRKGDRVELYSRKLEKMTNMFPDVVEAIRELKVAEIIFEGEALAFDSKKGRYFPFQQTMHRRRKHGIEDASKEFPLNVFVFDVLYIDGRDMTEQPYEKRRDIIEKTFKNKILQPSQMTLVSKTNELEKIFQNSISQGLEGIMAKDLTAPYTAGKRKFAWIKLKKSYGKSVDTIDAVVVGYYLGQGARAEFEFGGLLVAVYNPDRGKFETVARIGSGFSEDEMRNLQEILNDIKTKKPPVKLDFSVEKPDFWVTPKYVVEVAFDDITQSSMHTCGAKDGKGYALRFPRLVKLREDKGVEEITTTEEVVRMYELQHSRK
ncbi:DNA ligase [Candidatus Bilamarchaeum dharawalense]|uniref:DNA ligase n=1 Tax=Candidatus Bilamarchaeum dharawalense TaxID=2885759 RepID=A0A5E4LQC8_9ARCH|nr:DNA ligase [Candidatus Bilamarchaeum dharawalense]